MKKIILSFALVAAMLGTATTTTQAQQQGITTPAASPAASVEQKIGLTDVSVSYSRPSLKGRKLGTDLAPFGQVWRTGANASTIIKFSDEVSINGTKVPAGEYAILSIPTQNEWTIILSKNTKLGGNTAAYKQEEDQARFTVKPQTNPRSVETFTINFANLKTNAADMEILWDKTIVTLTLEGEVDSKVMAQIQEQIINGKEVSANAYATAASYYLDNNKDLKLASEWMKKANANEPRYWNLHTEAKIQAKMKNYKAAVATAEKSLDLAKKQNDDAYIRMNEKAIAEWKKMK